MKNLLLSTLALMMAFAGKGQITLEHTYAGNAQVVLFSSNGEKIMIFDTASIYLYNMDHSLWKTITPTHYAGYRLVGVSSISDNLFNSDNLVELIAGYSASVGTHPYYKADIINETSSILQSLDSSYVGYPHYDEVSSSYKIFVLNYLVPGYATKVYAVPGTLPCGVCGGLGTEKLSHNGSTIAVSDPAPNPSGGVARILYTLPEAQGNADIMFYNVAGQLVKSLPLIPQLNYIDINNSTLPAGTYMYNIVAGNVRSDTKSMIIK